MKTTALAPWFGSNRTLAANIGAALGGCEWVGVPFAGGMCELAHLKARTVLVGDLHRHVINLAMVVADDGMKAELVKRLDALPFHPDVLAAAQQACIRRESDPVYVIGLPMPAEAGPYHATLNRSGRIEWATDYFVCAWMARNATAGTDREFNAGLSIRWEAGGGDSAVRFRSATESLTAWHGVLRRCSFVCLDVFDFLEKVKDEPKHGLYLDPPFPGPGDKYKHTFDAQQQRKLARELAGFEATRIVCRFYDVALVRELYPESAWTWHYYEGRKQTNAAAPEVLLTRN